MNQTQLKPSEVRDIAQKTTTALEATNNLINRSYLANMRNYPVVAAENSSAINRDGDVRLFRIARIVQENKQSVLESTTAAYTAMGASGYSVFLFLKSDGCETELYIGTRGAPGRTLGQSAGNLLKETFKGHFPGSKLEPLNGKDTAALLDSALEQQDNPSASVTAVTGVPSLATDNRDGFMQGLEHFIDAAESRKYQAIILAEPVTPQELDRNRTGYERVATQLSVLAKTQHTFGMQESDSVGLNISEGISQSLGTSLGMTMTQGTSHSRGTTTTATRGTTTSETSFVGKVGKVASGAASIGAGAWAMGAGAALLTGPVGAAILGAGVGGVLAIGSAFGSTKGESESTSTGTSETSGTSSSYGETRTQSRTDTTTRTLGQSSNKTLGSSRQISLEENNKTVSNLLAKIDHHLERLNEARAYGGWRTAAYFIGDSAASTQSLASIFLGLMRGTRSSTEDFALTTWGGQNKKDALNWLARLMHPPVKPDATIASMLNAGALTPATLVSGKEMAIQLSLPRRSTSTVAVLHTPSFGRKVQRLDGANATGDTGSNARVLEIGKMRHLWHDFDTPIKLDVDQLASHVFITGSTGAGKSNTVYALLDQLGKQDVPFLVIEPAKGEYKQVFGQRENVRVFGTNAKFAELLRINPFRFPANTHVYEHIDRLVDVFSMCWPMYAAMPAVLKEAILQAYTACGWNLQTSENQWQPACFPNFADLLEQLRQVIDQSDWSEEVKSNYTGSLVTRVKSLTNGLNGLIFNGEETDNSALFDHNAIVDLSRIGSQETRSFITGILVIRLSEHRAEQAEMNQPLRHVTVLEEAHHLLKRGGGSQGVEGADIAGKAVEMLANAIAEMRSWGEGFIIADQSPSAVDMAAIRNTNTKIIMRLPEEMDRRAAGKSAALNDEQLEELARLPRGVAVIYQNDWLEPVLCRITKFDGPAKPWRYSPPLRQEDNSQGVEAVLQWLLVRRLPRPINIRLERLAEIVGALNISTRKKIRLQEIIQESRDTSKPDIRHEDRFTELASFVANDILQCRHELMRRTTECEDLSILNNTLDMLINQQIDNLDQPLKTVVKQCLIDDVAHHKGGEWWSNYQNWRENFKLENLQ